MNSSYERYLADISKFPRISLEREVELSAIIQNDCNEEQVEAAINELVQANFLLVIHCLKAFSRFLNSPAIQITDMDLIAEGNIGLVIAARRFNAQFEADHEGEQSSGVRFSTYACKCINSRMRRALKRGRFIHIPEHHFSYWTELGKLRSEHGEQLPDELISEKLKVSQVVLDMLKQGERSQMFALEDMTSDNDVSCWQEILPNEQSPRPDETVDTSLLKDLLLAEMGKLPERTRRMIWGMFFDESAPSLRDLGRQHGISSERCRQVCAQGLKTLRRQLRGRTARIDPRFVPSRARVAA